MTRNQYDRNVATIERLAKEILVQCGHYRRNTSGGQSHGEEMRVAYIMHAPAVKLLGVVKQARRRWDKEHPLS